MTQTVSKIGGLTKCYRRAMHENYLGFFSFSGGRGSNRHMCCMLMVNFSRTLIDTLVSDKPLNSALRNSRHETTETVWSVQCGTSFDIV